MTSLHTSLTSDQMDLVRETERERLAPLDEDALLELHKRIRRARNKYVGLYRRSGASGVAEHGGRGKAAQKNARNAARAEVFEDALSRVSTALAAESARAAKALRAERLAQARASKDARRAARQAATGDAPPSAPGAVADGGIAREHAGTAATAKRNASTAAAGARRQAARDGG